MCGGEVERDYRGATRNHGISPPLTMGLPRLSQNQGIQEVQKLFDVEM